MEYIGEVYYGEVKNGKFWVGTNEDGFEMVSIDKYIM
jgi:hypothetical protein